MPRVQLRLNAAPIDDWLADTSTEFPDAEFRILSALPQEDQIFDIVEVTTDNGDAVVRHFEGDPEVSAFELIHADGDAIIIQFLIPVSDTYDALVSSGIIPQQPVLLQEGWYSTEITASHARLTEYSETLASAGAPYQVVSLSQSHGSRELLTDRQWEFVNEAVHRGFYATPRECTLTGLAEALDVNVSAMSRLRHRAESRIIKQFVSETVP
ncbi:helix-turn-helix domain-containing protein (plasmid) [Salinigranum rubrum]|uniref:Helix-turn-helix domain-containing protein n=1 Tax=Salinigranum rubrum TaxID=755307 RepID=A0A2I8VQQ6_9EURY|nr:helix-turn-helix domain-containing protein [Salinigranum rubrum]AUV84260.1 helix-turn-helix domain-containing protein [Salinigranum rubrum]